MLKIRIFFVLVATWLCACSFAVAPAYSQNLVADFYHRNTLNLIVGAAVGGGSDTYARMIARHLPSYIPGHPSIVVKNMPAATSGQLASYFVEQAPRDGSLIGALDSSLVLSPLMTTRQLPYNPSKFNYLGSANSDTYLCAVRSDAPAKTYDEVFSRTVIMGATAPGSKSYDLAMVHKNVLGAKFKVVTGYRGTRELTLAIERGEVQGMCGLSWSTLVSHHDNWLKSGFIRVIVQDDLKGLPNLNKMGIPRSVSFAKTDVQRLILEFFFKQNIFSRPFAAPEGLPADRLAALRQGYLSTLRDKDLLADAAKNRLDISPEPGDELQTLVKELYAFPPDIIKRARQAVGGTD